MCAGPTYASGGTRAALDVRLGSFGPPKWGAIRRPRHEGEVMTARDYEAVEIWLLQRCPAGLGNSNVGAKPI